MPATELLVDGLDHPEGVAWDPRSGTLWAGGEDGQLYHVDLQTRTRDEAARAPGFVLGLAVDGRGRVVVCCSGAQSLCLLEGGAVRTLRDDDRLVSANLGRWHLTLLHVGLRGEPLHYPERWGADV